MAETAVEPDADMATRPGDFPVESSSMQRHLASLQSTLQLSSGGEPVDPSWRPHSCAFKPIQCAEPVLHLEPEHMEVSYLMS